MGTDVSLSLHFALAYLRWSFEGLCFWATVFMDAGVSECVLLSARVSEGMNLREYVDEVCF